MPEGLRKATFLALFLLLSAFAHAPLLRAGLLGKDLAALSARNTDPPEGSVSDLWRGAGAEVRPLATLSLSSSRGLWTREGRFEPQDHVWLRLENLVWLFACAGLLALALRRAVLPWTGSDAATAAGAAAALFAACHPLSVPVVAHAGARGELIALALSLAALAVFLRARQDRGPELLPIAVVLVLLAGFAAPLAALAAPVAAAFELASARRHRPVHHRLRTAATTLVVFLAAASVEAVAAAALGLRPWSAALPFAAFADAPASGGLATHAARSIEKLGLLVLPVPAGTRAAAPFLIAGALALIALQPALSAARSAPRLWGGMLSVVAVLLAIALAGSSSVRVAPEAYSRAEVLFAPAAIAAGGLAVCATAVSGLRRWLVPLCVALGYAALAHASALAWPCAAEELSRLRAELVQARELHGRGAHLVVVDPPATASGLEVLGDALQLVFDPAFEAQPAGLRGGQVLEIEARALAVWSREPRFDVLRREGLVVLFPPSSAARGRVTVPIPAPDPSTGPYLWRGQDLSPMLDLDPLEKRAVRVSVLPTAATDAAPRITWRAREPALETGERPGAWVEGEDGPVALYDLSGSPAWLCGRRIRRIGVSQDPADIVSIEVLDAIPGIGLRSHEPRADGWHFVLAANAAPRALASDARWTLTLLETGRLAYTELDAAPAGDPRAPGADEVFFPGAAPLGDPTREPRGASRTVSWSLEYRVGDVAVARASGQSELP